MALISYGGNLLTSNGYALHVTDPYNPLDVPRSTLRIALYPARDIRQYVRSGGTWSDDEAERRCWQIIGYETIGNREYLIMDYHMPNIDHPEMESYANIFNGRYSDMKVLGGDLTDRPVAFLFRNARVLSEVAMVDTRNVRTNTGNTWDMSYAFDGCTALTHMAAWPTGNCSGWQCAFRNCINLLEVPDFDMSGTIGMHSTFKSCQKVQTGAYRLYQKVSGLQDHDADVFTSCGINGGTAAVADLHRIPASWGGLGS